MKDRILRCPVGYQEAQSGHNLSSVGVAWVISFLLCCNTLLLVYPSALIGPSTDTNCAGARRTER